MADDLPYYETMYGILLQDWTWSYGNGVFAGTHYMLTKEYLSEGCKTTDYTTLSAGENIITFLYPHWIKKQYYIEGVFEGQLSVSCIDGDDSLLSYKVRLMKVDQFVTISMIGDTTTITPVNQDFFWDSSIGVGDDGVYQFYVTISPEVKVTDGERLYLEITLNTSNNYLVLYHSNDSTWEDIKISIPFRGL